MKFKGKKIFLGIVIISQMFAPVVLLVGIYKIMSTFGMTDSLVGLVFINAAFKPRPLQSGFCAVLSSPFLRKWNRQQLLTAAAKYLH